MTKGGDLEAMNACFKGMLNNFEERFKPHRQKFFKF
jgi:hypothetical protein